MTPTTILRMLDDRLAPDRGSNWAIRVSVALAFTLTGIDKVLPISRTYWIHVFDTIGLGQWFRYATFGIEVLGGLLFLVPPATTIGAAMLVATMLGAMGVQAFVFHHPVDSLFPGVYLAGVVAAFVKLRTARPGPTRRG